MTARLALAAAAVSMAIAVALGAFGAHALKSHVAPDLLAAWHTGVTYQAWHGLALLALGALMLHLPDNVALRYAAWLFIAGIVLFAGSLYVIALGGPAPFGLATPLGGVAFIAGWVALAIGVLRA